jgi:ubiquinone/menaquinone biosynthesis C-methylase UbiE
MEFRQVLRYSAHTMSERLQSVDPRPGLQVQYDFPDKVLARFKLYEFAEDGRNVQTEVVDDLSLQPGEVVADIGCSHGLTLVEMYKQQPEAHYFGLDLFPLAFMPAQMSMKAIGEAPIDFVVGSSEELPFADNAIDKLTSLFVLYHVADTDAALSEMQRVVRLGGTIIIATSGVNNKQLHRKLEAEIAKSSGSEPPKRFSKSFDAAVAEKVLPEYFEVVKHVTQQTNMIITPERVPDYYHSMVSMLEDFGPPIRGFKRVRAMQECVTQPLQEKLDRDGFFTDTIDRHYWVLRNTQKD